MVEQSNRGDSFPDGALSLIKDAAPNLIPSAIPSHLRSVIEKWLLGGVEQVYKQIPAAGEAFFPSLLRGLNILPDCAREDRKRIPRQGPVILVANHPFGLAEGLILGAILSDIRNDIKFLANRVLMELPQLREHLLPVDLSGSSDAKRMNAKSARQAIHWLDGGGLVVVFPAGEVAALRFPQIRISDPEWTDSVSRLARITQALVLPFFFHGTNSPAFHIAGLIHPQLRTALLPRELLKKSGHRVRVSIGSPIHHDRLKAASRESSATEYLRTRTFLLGARVFKNRPASPPLRERVLESQDSPALRQDIEALPPEQHLVQHGAFLVCEAAADQIPSVLREIGRLREITFRQAGEGTGKAVDLDSFDRHYRHLFLWNKEKQEIAGAYRFAKIDEVAAWFGLRGLYTNTLFRLSPGFYAAIQPALELGRSFVRPEYQRSYLPLLLLWKGFGQYIASRPQYRMLFGPVSISNDYSDPSRALMVSFLQARFRNDQLAAHVGPRHRYRVRRAGDCDPRNFATLLADIDELSEIVADLEPDHKGVPILLQHYLNLGGQILDFSVDHKFSKTLDGLIVVDLLRASRRFLERYLGKDATGRFLLHHAPSQASGALAEVTASSLPRP